MNEEYDDLNMTDIPEEEERRPIDIRKLILLGAAAAAGLCLILGILLFIRSRRPFAASELMAEITQPASGDDSYALFGSKVLRYSRSGAALTETDGKELWNYSYSFLNPVLVLQGEYGALGDLAGDQILIFNKDGVSGSLRTNSPILAFSVSSHGALAVALDEGLSSVIRFYDRKATALDITIKLEMSMSGCPLALALSPEGSGLMMSVVTSSLGELNSQLVFYNFSVGKSDSSRLIGYYNYDGTVFPELRYLSEKTALAVGDDRLEIFSLEQENKPQLKKEILLEGELQDFACGGGHLAAMLPDRVTGGLKLSVWDLSGNVCFTEDVSGACRMLQLTSDYVLLSADSGITMWNYKGRVRFEGTLAHSGTTVFSLDRKTLLQFDGEKICRYRLR